MKANLQQIAIMDVADHALMDVQVVVQALVLVGAKVLVTNLAVVLVAEVVEVVVGNWYVYT